ncbi:hypothetical protein TREMEDRAFT_55907 [Tremella mesenterica DSM 1558]|nr:uncharacterized protein TREMEDRAFT_55907 [Tremella mesenterica DSM 1558]EIW72374.1 hypothetical protein TREMEDRAFT_55907 [Tremella mesenterica DSM 1558]
MFNGRSTAESSSTPSSQSHHVIDLTLSDSDDDGDDQASFRLPGTVHSHPNVAGSSHPPLGTVARANGGFNSMSSPISVSASPTTPTYSKYGPPVHPANPLSSREIPLDLQDRYLPPPKSGTGYHDYATYRPPPTRPHHPRDRTQDGQHYDGWSR